MAVPGRQYEQATSDDHAILTGAGVLRNFIAKNVSASTVHLQIHDAAAEPSDMTTAILASFTLEPNVGPTAWSGWRRVENGIRIVASTADDSLTLTGTNDIQLEAQFDD